MSILKQFVIKSVQYEKNKQLVALLTRKFKTMKQIILTIVVFFTVAVSFGQDKYQMKKVNYFVEAAQKEYSLDKTQRKDLLDARIAYFKEYQKVLLLFSLF